MSWTRKRTVIATALPALAVGAGAVAIGTAGAAGTVSNYRTAVSCARAVPAVIDPLALYTRDFDVSGSTVRGTVPAIKVQPDGATVTAARIQLTVTSLSRNAGLGNATLPGHSYTIPVSVHNPPVTQSVTVAAGSTPGYSIRTDGTKAHVKVTLVSAAATRVESHLVVGSTCPPGETEDATLDPNSPPPSPTASASTSTSTSPTASATPSTSASPSTSAPAIPVPTTT